MKIKDAIDWIDIARMGYICDPNECGLEKNGDPCKAFHCDEIHDALVMAIEALEKQIPKKPNVKKWVALDDAVYTYHCPHCDVDYNKYYIGSHHCRFCGQAIDWSEVE